jgi:hypothetical protein
LSETGFADFFQGPRFVNASDRIKSLILLRKGPFTTPASRVSTRDFVFGMILSKFGNHLAQITIVMVTAIKELAGGPEFVQA